uniref:Uncharacterized protein n=1 Tax=Globodera rostochiensis TaxID=31243 RepID=A0A914GXJ5_GLORO
MLSVTESAAKVPHTRHGGQKTASTFAAFSHDFDTYFVNWQLARRSNLLNGADTCVCVSLILCALNAQFNFCCRRPFCCAGNWS